MGTVGFAVWPRGRVALTDEDALWLGRSLAGETDRSEAGRAAAAWAMLQRMVWFLNSGRTTTEGLPCSRAPTGRGIPELEPVRRPMDFTGAIRCFSSVVNSFQTDRVAARKARRRFFISASWPQLEARSPGIKDFVYRFLRGDVPNPVPGAADFDAPDEVPRGAVVLYRVGGNSFLGEPGFPRTPGYVRIEPARGLQRLGVSPAMLALGAAATVAASVVIYFAVRPVRNPRRKRNASQRLTLKLADLGVVVVPKKAWPRVGLSYGTKAHVLPASTQFRTTQQSVDAERVAALKASIGQGNQESVEVFRLKDGAWWVVDGHHRLAAYLQLGLPVPVEVHSSGPYVVDPPKLLRRTNVRRRLAA